MTVMLVVPTALIPFRGLMTCAHPVGLVVYLSSSNATLPAQVSTSG